LITDKGSISPISRIEETICLNLRVVITPSGTFFDGINSSSGICQVSRSKPRIRFSGAFG
jgi:hypothetical protein